MTSGWRPASQIHRLPKATTFRKALGLTRISQTTPSRAGQESVKCESAEILSGDGVLKHSEVDKVEQIRSLPAIDTRSRNEFEKCGLKSPLPQIPLVATKGSVNDGC